MNSDNMETNNSNSSKNEKKTLGRRKIEMKKIDKKTSLQVTFTKRKHGLFRKASELALLCGAEIAILVQSPSEKVFSFGHPTVEAVINRGSAGQTSLHGDGGRSGYEEVMRRLEAEKSKTEMRARGGGLWWEEPFERLELLELEEFLEALEGLRKNVAERVQEFEKEGGDSAASSCLIEC